MAVIILPAAQDDLLSLQAYLLDKWASADWLKAEDESCEKLVQVDTNFLTGTSVQELASVGIFEYQNVFTSHHKLVYRRISPNTRPACTSTKHRMWPSGQSRA